MKKFILSIFVITSFGFYVISQNVGNSSNNFIAQTPITITTNTNTKKNPTSVVSIPNTSKTIATQNQNAMGNGNGMMNNRIYNDGTYIGPIVDAYYGNVQVKAIISNAKLTDVQFLDYPHDRGTSVRINSYALPILKQEAIQAQSANVNAVSGASATSPAFIESLTGALNQAKV